MRGEKLYPISPYMGPLGSPPLARGKGQRSGPLRDQDRITPACAGKSNPIARSIQQGKDHPRLRGEKLEIMYGEGHNKGSPPLARGKVYRLFVLCYHVGSPPLARGKAHLPGHADGLFRITPACAGKRGPPDGSGGGRRDHPRLRGEKFERNAMRRGYVGSPPLARGKGPS